MMKPEDQTPIKEMQILSKEVMTSMTPWSRMPPGVL